AQLASPEGGFYCALDADSEGKEGEYYVWTKEEIHELLGDEFPIFASYFSITENDVWEDEKFILYRKKNDEAFCKQWDLSADELRVRVGKWMNILAERRKKRVAP